MITSISKNETVEFLSHVIDLIFDSYQTDFTTPTSTTARHEEDKGRAGRLGYEYFSYLLLLFVYLERKPCRTSDPWTLSLKSPKALKP